MKIVKIDNCLFVFTCAFSNKNTVFWFTKGFDLFLIMTSTTYLKILKKNIEQKSGILSNIND